MMDYTLQVKQWTGDNTKEMTEFMEDHYMWWIPHNALSVTNDHKEYVKMKIGEYVAKIVETGNYFRISIEKFEELFSQSPSPQGRPGKEG